MISPQEAKQKGYQLAIEEFRVQMKALEDELDTANILKYKSEMILDMHAFLGDDTEEYIQAVNDARINYKNVYSKNRDAIDNLEAAIIQCEYKIKNGLV